MLWLKPISEFELFFRNILFVVAGDKRVFSHRDILDALKKRGFKTNFGIQGTGFGLLAWSRAGGYYLGTSKISNLPCRFG